MAEKKAIARRMGGGIMNRIKSNTVPGVVGAAAELVDDFAGDHSATINEKWWGGPAMMFALSLVMKRPQVAHALAGAAGYAAAFNYKLYQFQVGSRQKSPVRMFKPKDAAAGAPAAANAAGDAGMGYGPDAGMGYGDENLPN